MDWSLICVVDGETPQDQLGGGLAFVGDLDGDGRDEFVAGARDAGTGGGEAYVFSFDGVQCGLMWELDGGPGSLDFGYLFADGGRDVDLDGTPDVYVADFPANRAHVFSGATGESLHMLTGDGNGQFGLGGLVADVNGDLHADLVLAAWVSNAGGSQAGKVFIYSGKTGAVIETFTHDIPGATFGFDAKGLGDTDGDGRADYLITAASDLAQRGRSYVIAGTVARADLNGDGFVNVFDLIALLGAWGPCAAGGDPCFGDTNLDGRVGADDVLTVILNWD
ncbi:MAG: hypothetical protein ACYTGC_18380 [Planctomycetota bacterium]